MSSLSSPIKRLAVIGAGQMGTGIAYVSALRARCTSVTLVDSSPQQLSKGSEFLESLLQKDLKKGKIREEEAKHARGAWKTVGSIDELKQTHPGAAGGEEGLDMVIEAATEKLPVKQSLFSSLSRAFPDPQTILATNTSSISISKIAASAVLPSEELAKSRSASRVVGLHWMNPVPVLPLVEIIPALQTSEETLQRARHFAEVCGKTLVHSKDSPGFIANRLLMPYINEAIICLDEGVASKEDIDTTMHLAMGHPMGPLKLADFIGLDTCLSIMMTLHEETGDSKYRPAVLLGRMVDAGWVGKKGGKGFYDY
ncbi:putative 3-hydroxybutyryl-CoA dehydrogenase [Microstroma glucosiphilum]|uniref:Putative 3-hydroxybutyryl-CoA dehydrogenase n=1 Tax=Pseudomicrostroma glucosiphilum TaxID=1684307 RepID=A0A316U3P3_9BASI|nr:putative 3-hydroxybutyryl-CoA dehydrogenase [Pseudomicrostroma glucosiphilum]PWN19857.1 putative 3-hydroxybutyryl-CoA dehydrogenase [Pseudomicrostroma glucosiphilum]